MTEVEQIRALLCTREFGGLQRLKSQESFDLLDLFDDAIVENSWSRILRFLFDSKGRHQLYQRPFRQWLATATRSAAGLAEWASRLPPSRSSQTRVEVEWLTDERRRLDILVKVLGMGGRLEAVLGIENKLAAGEGENQLSDYQAALARTFRGVPKILVFLTPEGREPESAKEPSECRVVSCSYETITEMCQKMLPSVSGELQLLVNGLSTHLAGRRDMETKAQRLVRRLFAMPRYTRALQLIREYTPTFPDLCEETIKELRGCKFLKQASWGAWLLPKRLDRLLPADRTTDRQFDGKPLVGWVFRDKKKRKIDFGFTCSRLKSAHLYREFMAAIESEGVDVAKKKGYFWCLQRHIDVPDFSDARAVKEAIKNLLRKPRRELPKLEAVCKRVFSAQRR